MRVDPGGVQPVGPKRPDKSDAASRKEAVSGAEKAEGAEATARAEEIQAATEAVRSAPEVRADRVAELQAKVRAGELKVDADKIAERIVEGE